MTIIPVVFLAVIFFSIGVILAFREMISRIDRLDDRVRALETRRREEDSNMGKIIQEEMLAHAERRRRQAQE